MKLRVTLVYEYETDPADYDLSLRRSPKAMAQFDLDNAPEIMLESNPVIEKVAMRS